MFYFLKLIRPLSILLPVEGEPCVKPVDLAVVTTLFDRRKDSNFLRCYKNNNAKY